MVDFIEDFSILVERLKDKRDDHLIVILGPSGVGKNYVSEKLAAALDTHYLDMDSFGFKQKMDGKECWWVDQHRVSHFLDQHREIGVVSGTCTNFQAVFSQLFKEYNIHLVYLYAEPELFRLTNLAKASFGNHPTEWKNGWLDKSRKTDVEIDDYSSTKYWEFMVGCASGMVYANSNIDLKLPPLLIGEKFSSWARELYPRHDEIVSVMLKQLSGITAFKNTLDSSFDVRLIQGWHPDQVEDLTSDEAETSRRISKPTKD